MDTFNCMNYTTCVIPKDCYTALNVHHMTWYLVQHDAIQNRQNINLFVHMMIYVPGLCETSPTGRVNGTVA